MRFLSASILLFLLLSFYSPAALLAQKMPADQTLTRLLFVFDASKSMYARWESGQKIDVAKRLLTEMLDSLQSAEGGNFELGLRVYGHQSPVPPQDCNDTRLEVPFGKNNYGQIRKVIRNIKPQGTTPIARSLQRAAYDFGACQNCRNIIILITDGIEACDEDPCAASRLLQKRGIALKPFVIGIGLDQGFRQSFECVGAYYDAAKEKTFKEVLGIVIAQALNNTTVQVNLIDENGFPTETDVALSFKNITSGQVKTQIIHTLNFKGNPDTIYLDPLVPYRMTVHSLPERHLDSFHVSAGRHNIIGLDLPRGTLQLQAGHVGASEPIKAIVREANKKEILHVQNFGDKTRYLQGFYDLEILTLPRLRLESVEIEGGQTTRIAIPPPGLVNFSGPSPGIGSILWENGNELEWVIDIDPTRSRQTLNLQPGNYRIVFRSSSSQMSLSSLSKNFSVYSGTTTTVKLK